MFTSFLLVSCKLNYYQVYEVKSPNLIQRDNSLVFENEDCKVSYNLWSNKGAVSYIIENKTDKDLFLDMTQSFFIKNGAAYDYFQNKTYETREYSIAGLGYSASETYIGKDGYWPSQYFVPLTYSEKVMAKMMKGNSVAVTQKEPEYVCIPANSYKYFYYYNVNPSFIETCDKDKDYPNNSSVLNTLSESNTPLKFTNRIAYSFQENNSALKYIDNSFWLAQVKNYSEKEAVEKRQIKRGCKEDLVSPKQKVFKIGGPNQFYVSYIKK